MEEATFRAQLNASLTQTTTPAIALQAAPTNWNTEDYDEPAAAPEDDEEDFLSEEVVHMPVKPKCKKGKGKGKANAKAALEVAPPRLEPEVNISAMPGKDVNAANTDASESTPHVNEAEEEEDEDEEDEENEEEDEEEVDGDAAEDSDEEEDLEEEEDSEEEESEEE
ncbi:hypothetical protein K474DRAFT_1177258 [Panus rudis PR-1116 ss-1]|nr:hypothetical protein K474DRAFT_1177258 [Panus rudis PR-1116 ss-1]